MTAVEIVGYIVGVLLLISRFLQSAKPVWGRLPKVVAALIPGIVSLIPQVIELLNQTKTWSDLANYLIASVSIVVVGLFPKHERTDAPLGSGTGGGSGTGSHVPPYEKQRPYYPPQDPPSGGSY